MRCYVTKLVFKNYRYYLEQNITCIKYYQSSFKTSDYPKENKACKKSVQIRPIKKGIS